LAQGVFKHSNSCRVSKFVREYDIEFHFSRNGFRVLKKAVKLATFLALGSCHCRIAAGTCDMLALFRGVPQYLQSAEIVPVRGLRPPIRILFCSFFAVIRPCRARQRCFSSTLP